MHSLLRRQIRRFFGAVESAPGILSPLFDAIDSAYEQHDIDRKMIERSLELTSREMLERNHRLSLELKEREAAERELAHSLSILESTLNATADGILVVGNDQRLVSHNERVMAMWGISPALFVEKDNRALLRFVAAQLRDPEEFLRAVAQLCASDDKSLGLIEFKDGRAFERYSQPCRLGGNKIGRVWSFRDVTDRHQAEQNLTYLANYDPLTGLANRTLLMDRLRQGVANAHRHGDTMAVLFLDLDQFKFINDSLGHGAGDELLKVVAARLQACVRESDTVARSGGDEFVLILNELRGGEVAADRPARDAATASAHPLIIESLEKILGTVAQMVMVEERELNVTCSIGVSLYPDDGQDVDALLRNADVAMYRAKELGRNNYQFYTADLNARTSERLTLQGKLRHALRRGEFSLHYQPKIALGGGCLSGVEALLRWNNPELGPIAPIHFIPLLEDNGMIVEVGRWVLEQAAADYRRWQVEGRDAPRIAVNISQLQLEQEGFVTLVDGLVGRAEGDAGIDLEITESLIMKDIEVNISKLRAIRDMGVRIAIDDFGTGYSSLSYLAKLPVNALKIDRAFIARLPSQADDLAIVTTIISLAHSLKLKVIAEGVETQAQSALLEGLRCDEIQGYLISPALAAGAFWAWHDKTFGVATPSGMRPSARVTG